MEHHSPPTITDGFSTVLHTSVDTHDVNVAPHLHRVYQWPSGSSAAASRTYSSLFDISVSDTFDPVVSITDTLHEIFSHSNIVATYGGRDVSYTSEISGALSQFREWARKVSDGIGTSHA